MHINNTLIIIIMAIKKDAGLVRHARTVKEREKVMMMQHQLLPPLLLPGVFFQDNKKTGNRHYFSLLNRRAPYCPKK